MSSERITMGRRIAAARAIMAAEFKESLTWRWVMVFSIISGPLFILVNVAVWKGFFAAAPSGVIGGYTYNEMISYFSIIALLSYLIFDMFQNDVMQDISEGTLTQSLLKPYSYFLMLFFRKVANRTLALLIEFIPVTLVVILVGIPLEAEHPLWLIVFVALAFCISFCIHVMLGMLAFWVTKPRGFIWSWEFLKSFLLGMAIPLSVFPLWYQNFLSYTPLPYFFSIPTRVAMGMPLTIGATEISLAVAALIGIINLIALLVIMHFMWYQGVKRYTGVGQ